VGRRVARRLNGWLDARARLGFDGHHGRHRPMRGPTRRGGRRLFRSIVEQTGHVLIVDRRQGRARTAARRMRNLPQERLRPDCMGGTRSPKLRRALRCRRDSWGTGLRDGDARGTVGVQRARLIGAGPSRPHNPGSWKRDRRTRVRDRFLDQLRTRRSNKTILIDDFDLTGVEFAFQRSWLGMAFCKREHVEPPQFQWRRGEHARVAASPPLFAGTEPTRRRASYVWESCSAAQSLNIVSGATRGRPASRPKVGGPKIQIADPVGPRKGVPYRTLSCQLRPPPYARRAAASGRGRTRARGRRRGRARRLRRPRG
jgi:hypothetical protein